VFFCRLLCFGTTLGAYSILSWCLCCKMKMYRQTVIVILPQKFTHRFHVVIVTGSSEEFAMVHWLSLYDLSGPRLITSAVVSSLSCRRKSIGCCVLPLTGIAAIVLWHFLLEIQTSVSLGQCAPEIINELERHSVERIPPPRLLMSQKCYY